MARKTKKTATRRYNTPTRRTEVRLRVDLRRLLEAAARLNLRSITSELEAAIAAHCQSQPGARSTLPPHDP